MARVGLVVIGRNEGERLKRCLKSAEAYLPNIVYVDSGSTDGSIELAKTMGAAVISLDLSEPFTAARARNAGFAKLKEVEPFAEYVQFVDGDCELDRDWVKKAAAFLDANPDVAVVSGRLREINPNDSVYNYLCNIEWDTPTGETDTCGGNAMMRSIAFEQVGGFDPSVIAGEEPDLCWRMRTLRWKIYRIDAEMALHDAAMKHFSQWWSRNKRSGHAAAEAFQRRGGTKNRAALRQIISNTVWALPLAWPLWPVLWWRVYRRRRDATYATFIVLGKLPHLHGQIKYFLDRKLGKHGKIIEYKK